MKQGQRPQLNSGQVHPNVRPLFELNADIVISVAQFWQGMLQNAAIHPPEIKAPNDKQNFFASTSEDT
jgi:hypothetical protein